MSLRDQILSSNDIVREPVTVPEWKDEQGNPVVVEVRSMSGAERTRILDLAIQDGGEMNLQLVYPEVVIASTFDPDSGEQVFTPADRDALQQKNAKATDRIAQIGLRLGGFSADAGDVVGKDSSPNLTDGSSSV